MKLSVCIPTYNRAEFIGQTLDSILSQINDDVEVVVSDNCSNDNTSGIVKKYININQNIKYCRNDTNLGADRNYLKAVEIASGDYCWLFGSDDIMKKDAISKLLVELASGYDLFLCGFTLCDRIMHPIADHHISKIKSSVVLNLSDTLQRKYYFQNALTTTAFFSFIGSIIVKKSKWDSIKIEDEFVGSLWVHTAKCFALIERGLTLKYLPEALLYKRGDNDSFTEKGVVHRYKIAIEGYSKIADTFFGHKSGEAIQIRRVIRNEYGLTEFLSAKILCKKNPLIENENLLDNLASKTFEDKYFTNFIRLFIYKVLPLKIYIFARHLYRNIMLLRNNYPLRQIII